MDGPRRHFDDIDGCGGPPAGEQVSVEDAAGARRLGFARRRSTRDSGGPARGRGRTTQPLSPGAGLVDQRRALAAGLGVATAAAGAAFAIVTVIGPDLLEAVGPNNYRHLAMPFVAAALVFEAVAVAGILVTGRGSGGGLLRPPSSVSGQDLLRGGVAFLLALFAASFITSPIGVRAIGWAVTPAAFDVLLAVEVLLTVLVAPVVEERLFRGLLLVGLRHRFGAVIGVLGQAAIFGAATSWMGGSGGRVGAGIGAFAIGAVFGWFAHATDDLKPGMIGHAFLATWLLAGRIGW